VKTLPGNTYQLESIADCSLRICTQQELHKAYVEDRLNIENGRAPKVSKKLFSELPESFQREALRRQEAVKSFCSKYPGSLRTQDIEEHLNLRPVEICPQRGKVVSISQFRRWLLAWIDSNHDINVFVRRKPGPKTRRYSEEVGLLATQVIQDVYLSEQRASVAATYDVLKNKVDAMNLRRPVPLKMPSKQTFYRTIADLDKRTVMEARKGKKAADRAFRLSGKGVITKYILERAEVDHTELDVLVVNPKTNLPIGRPNFTCIIDVHSRYPLGFYLGFEKPSSLSVMRALRNAILPK
jgi:hypothetical protein